ncbi:MAG: YceI family protein [Saprospiraceae bacterium]|nr:YceI family protein [Saprospiraceae bacterium]
MRKTLFLAAFILSSMMVFASNPTTPVKSSIDIEKSTIEWVGKKITGKHNGVINLQSGELEYDNGRLSGGSFVIDMTSIAVRDLDGGMRGKLEGHLKSPDFFDVANHPTATFTITNVSPGEGGAFNITGDLTIKGITNPLTFSATSGDGSFNADIKVDRTLYDVRYGSGKFFDNLGDKTIYDDFELTVALVTK